MKCIRVLMRNKPKSSANPDPSCGTPEIRPSGIPHAHYTAVGQQKYVRIVRMKPTFVSRAEYPRVKAADVASMRSDVLGSAGIR